MTTTVDTPAEKVDLKTTEEQVESVEKIKDADVASPTEEKDKLVADKKEKIPKPTVHKTDYETDVVYLYQFSRSAALPSCSPQCFKVEAFLRMAGIKYENVDHKVRYKSKKGGQLPFVELNGKEIEESDNIIKELSAHFEKDLDAGLTEDQKTVSYAMESMLNNHTFWVARWWRMKNPRNFLETTGLDIKQTISSRLPKPFCNMTFNYIFGKRMSQSINLGSGTYTAEEILEAGKRDLATLSQLLGTKDYFFGAEPHLLDCHAFAHLTQFIYAPFENIDKWISETHPNLISFVDRMKARYFEDWDRMCKNLELNTHLYKEGEEPPMSEAEKKAAEAKKAKEEAKKAKEEAKKAKEEQKKKEKEEKERKKAEEAERKKAEKEAAEKAKAEAAEKAKAEKEAAEKAAAEKAAAEEAAKTEEAKTEESKPAEPAAETTEAAPAAEEKKE